jgi:hypothetical protein
MNAASQLDDLRADFLANATLSMPIAGVIFWHRKQRSLIPSFTLDITHERKCLHIDKGIFSFFRSSKEEFSDQQEANMTLFASPILPQSRS